MARYVATVRTSWSPPKVFDYLADVRNFEHWDPGVRSSKMVRGEGPGLGTAYEVAVTGATLTYDTERFDPPTSTLLVASTNLLTSRDLIRVEAGPDGGATAIYDAELSLRGPLKLADPVLRLVFDRIGDRAAAGLAQALDGELVTS